MIYLLNHLASWQPQIFIGHRIRVLACDFEHSSLSILYRLCLGMYAAVFQCALRRLFGHHSGRRCCFDYQYHRFEITDSMYVCIEKNQDPVRGKVGRFDPSRKLVGCGCRDVDIS